MFVETLKFYCFASVLLTFTNKTSYIVSNIGFVYNTTSICGRVVKKSTLRLRYRAYAPRKNLLQNNGNGVVKEWVRGASFCTAPSILWLWHQSSSFCTLFSQFLFVVNQLEKLEAAKAVWSVVFLPLRANLIRPYWVLVGPTWHYLSLLGPAKTSSFRTLKLFKLVNQHVVHKTFLFIQK